LLGRFFSQQLLFYRLGVFATSLVDGDDVLTLALNVVVSLQTVLNPTRFDFALSLTKISPRLVNFPASCVNKCSWTTSAHSQLPTPATILGVENELTNHAQWYGDRFVPDFSFLFHPEIHANS
jgi:hypothetical protein